MEEIFSVSWNVFYIMIGIFILVFISQKREINLFVKGLFIVGFSFAIFSDLIQIPIYSLPIDFFKNTFRWGESFYFVYILPLFLSYFLLILGVSLLVGKDYSANEKINTKYPELVGQRRSVGISLLLFIVTLEIYFYFWLYRTVKDLKNNFENDIPYTPGKAVGFLFIPIFNIYWSFYILFTLPLSIKKIEEKHYGENIGFHFHPVFISVAIIVIEILSYLALFNMIKNGVSQYIGNLLFLEAAIIILWLTIQAKLNSFFEVKSNIKPIENA